MEGSPHEDDSTAGLTAYSTLGPAALVGAVTGSTPSCRDFTNRPYLFLRTAPHQNDGGGTPEQDHRVCRLGDNGCNAAGAVDFKDDGDVFTVHDYCEEGYGLLAFFCPGECDDQDVPIVDHIENTDGFDGAPVSRSVDIKEGVTYEVELIVKDGNTVITSNAGTVTE